MTRKYRTSSIVWLIGTHWYYHFQSNANETHNQDYLGGIIVFVAIITALFTVQYYPDGVSASTVALAINYTLLVPIYLNWVVKLLSDMEMYIGAVERISHYIDRQNSKAPADNDIDENPTELMAPRSEAKCEYFHWFFIY